MNAFHRKGDGSVTTAAIVEDMAFDRKILQDLLHQYGEETGAAFRVREYESGESFLSAGEEDPPDLIFMDIMMKEKDGMTTARQLRRDNDQSLLIFVTSMVQYAVQGYSVDATDFLVKPLNYPVFKLCMDRVMRKLRLNGKDLLSFSNREGTWTVPVRDICYIESLDHKVYVHTIDRVLTVDSSLAALEKQCAGLSFFRCHVSYLVNLAFVERISGNDVWVNGDRLSISRYRRRDFLDAWSAYIGA